MCNSLDPLFACLLPTCLLDYAIFTLFNKGPWAENTEQERPVLAIEFKSLGYSTEGKDLEESTVAEELTDSE